MDLVSLHFERKKKTKKEGAHAFCNSIDYDENHKDQRVDCYQKPQ